MDKQNTNKLNKLQRTPLRICSTLRSIHTHSLTSRTSVLQAHWSTYVRNPNLGILRIVINQSVPGFFHRSWSDRGVKLTFLHPVHRLRIRGAIPSLPITVTARSEAWTLFSRSNAGIMGSNPNQGMDVCILCVYSVFLLFCVQVAALRRADHSSRESYRLCKKDYEIESRGQGPTKGCRAIDEWLNEWMNTFIILHVFIQF
jgi:hypothetical protein